MCIIKIISRHPECFKLCHLPHCSIPQVTLLSFSYTVLQKCTLHTKHRRWMGRKHEVAHASHLCPSGDAQRKGPYMGEVGRGSLRILGALIPKANPGLGILNPPFSSGLGPPLGPWASPQLSWSQIPPIVPGGDGHGTVGASLGVDTAWAPRPQGPGWVQQDALRDAGASLPRADSARGRWPRVQVHLPAHTQTPGSAGYKTQHEHQPLVHWAHELRAPTAPSPAVISRPQRPLLCDPMTPGTPRPPYSSQAGWRPGNVKVTEYTPYTTCCPGPQTPPRGQLGARLGQGA